jgi:hypothetical protein
MARRVLIESKPSITKVGPQGTPLEYYVQTEYQVDNNGKLIAGTQKSYIAYNNSTFLGKNWVQAAETSNGGASWTFKNGIDGKPIFGADAQRSLKEGALKADTQKAIKSSAQNAAQPLSNQDQNQLAVSAKNQAPDAVTTEEAQASLSDITSKETEQKSRSSFPKNLTYPADLQIAQQDVIQFNMVKYSPRKFKSGEGTINPIQERRGITDELIIGRVYLPIPGGIADTNAVTWGSDSMDPIQSTLANIALSAIGGGGSAGANAAAGSMEDAANLSADMKIWVQNYFAQAATGTTNLLSRTQGAITNPNMELLFSGPTLRPFTFNFKLSARGTKDRDQIRQIIRFFKQGMAVQRTQSQLFLKAPHTFKIRYLHKDKDHQYLNLIKECALQSFTVNYTPEGNYMTFADGLMTSYEISMQFQELEPVFNDDYGNLDGKSIDTNIGY